MNYIPNTDKDRQEMMKTIGISSMDELFVDIPESARIKENLDFPKPLSEPELIKHLQDLSKKNADLGQFTCFLGAGAYNHFIPSVVKHIVRRSEFYTAYTPYQAEVSQGTLQSIYEYQTMICNLTGMDVANASMYDGATSVAEAANLACHYTGSPRGEAGRKEIIISKAVHPEYKKVLYTYSKGPGWKIKEASYNEKGITDLEEISEKVACVIIQHPNFFGNLEQVDEMAEKIHGKGALFIVVIDPISLGILKRPGDYGADIAIGEGQALGNPLYFGGPYLGIFAAKKDFIRFMPGRIAGRTTDNKGNAGYVLTLQTREQHIKRERATSNICSNEALNALASAVYLSCLGAEGLKKVAELCISKANYAKEQIKKIEGYSIPFENPTFKEFVVKCPASIKKINKKLSKNKIIGGLDLGKFYKELKNHMLLCVTETISKEEIDRLVNTLKEA